MTHHDLTLKKLKPLLFTKFCVYVESAEVLTCKTHTVFFSSTQNKFLFQDRIKCQCRGQCPVYHKKISSVQYTTQPIQLNL